MKLSEFNFELPAELIAQEPLPQRDASRLLVLPENAPLQHSAVKKLPQFLRAGDLLVFNDTRVARAKLVGRKSTGGKIDGLLTNVSTQSLSSKEQTIMLRGGGIRAGSLLHFSARDSEKPLTAKVLERVAGAAYRVEFDEPERLSVAGELPLPPYIKKKLDDGERYQTIYSNIVGSLAAPTAGLHFTPELFAELGQIGVQKAHVTLHVGLGTFAPIRAENVQDWKMHSEFCEVSEGCAATLNQAIANKRRIFAIGTTTLRTLESLTENGLVQAGSKSTDIFIYPGYAFKFPYAGLFTNFHLPESTLLLLACAFAGKEKLLAAYAEAVAQKYRFFSLGDAMLIFRQKNG